MKQQGFAGMFMREAVSPKIVSKSYSWGKLVTIEVGNSYSFPLHPKEQELVCGLEDGKSVTYKDETNKSVSVNLSSGKLKFVSGDKKATVSQEEFNKSCGKPLKEATSATDKKLIIKNGKDSIVVEVDPRGQLAFTSSDGDHTIVVELTGGETRTLKEWLDRLP